MPSIHIDHVTKKIQNETVLDDINLTLEANKIYGFRGKNGSGKTMLFRAISGLIKPTSGYVKVGNYTIGKDLSFPKSIGILIESPGFIPEYSGIQKPRTARNFILDHR